MVIGSSGQSRPRPRRTEKPTSCPVRELLDARARDEQELLPTRHDGAPAERVEPASFELVADRRIHTACRAGSERRAQRQGVEAGVRRAIVALSEREQTL